MCGQDWFIIHSLFVCSLLFTKIDFIFSSACIDHILFAIIIWIQYLVSSQVPVHLIANVLSFLVSRSGTLFWNNKFQIIILQDIGWIVHHHQVQLCFWIRLVLIERFCYVPSTLSILIPCTSSHTDRLSFYHCKYNYHVIIIKKITFQVQVE